jgi:hypothetical protein
MKLLNKRQQDSYLHLIQELPLMSITSDEHLDAAQAMLGHHFPSSHCRHWCRFAESMLLAEFKVNRPISFSATASFPD